MDWYEKTKNILEHIFANSAPIPMASTLSWICYLSIQTHVTIFKKMYTLIKSPMKLWCKVTPKPSPETIKRETNFLHRFWPAKWLQNEYPKLYSLGWFWGLCPMVSHWGVFGRLGCRFEWHWVTTLRSLGGLGCHFWGLSGLRARSDGLRWIQGQYWCQYLLLARKPLKT